MRHPLEVIFRCASNQLLVLRKHCFSLIFCTCKLVTWISLILNMCPVISISFLPGLPARIPGLVLRAWTQGAPCFAYGLQHSHSYFLGFASRNLSTNIFFFFFFFMICHFFFYKIISVKS